VQEIKPRRQYSPEVTSPQISAIKKSSSILINKFKKEFSQSLRQLSQEGKEKIVHPHDCFFTNIETVNITFLEFRNIVYCLGFVDSLQKDCDLLNQVWNLLKVEKYQATIKAESLFNFLCYL